MTEEEIKIEKPDEQKLKDMDIFSWPIWTKEVSEFDWFYDSPETCYILEGEVEVKPTDGRKAVTFGPGDLVVFPKGLPCVWNVKKPVKKHYNFG
jgi:uncharacterized cupin superfamily protein